MKDTELVAALRICADNHGFCCVCSRYGAECKTTFDRRVDLLREAADLLEYQRKLIIHMGNIVNIFENRTCDKCDYTRDNDMRCMCDKSQWAGTMVVPGNYCGHFLQRNDRLTQDELRKRRAPVWCSCETLDGDDGFWCLCRDGNITTPSGDNYDVEEIQNWVFLPMRPERI